MVAVPGRTELSEKQEGPEGGAHSAWPAVFQVRWTKNSPAGSRLKPADTSQWLAVNVTRALVFATHRGWACGFPFSALVSCQLVGAARQQACCPRSALPGRCRHPTTGRFTDSGCQSSPMKSPVAFVQYGPGVGIPDSPPGPVSGLGGPEGGVRLCRHHLSRSKTRSLSAVHQISFYPFLP